VRSGLGPNALASKVSFVAETNRPFSSEPAVTPASNHQGDSMSNAPPRRRWLAFSLRTMFVVLTVSGLLLCIAPDIWVAHGRVAMRSWIKENGGYVETYSEFAKTYLEFDRQPHKEMDDDFGEKVPEPPELSRIRKWMGDEPIVVIELQSGTLQAELDQVRLLFPEARCRIDSSQGSGSGGGGGVF
jgi:hypothetical protein